MPFTVFSRMKDGVAVGFIFAVFLTFFATVVPNYQKYAYKNTEAKAYDKYENYAGYPAAAGFPAVESLDELENVKNRNFTITLDVSRLTPLDFYMDIADQTFSTNGFMRMINNNDYGGIGRFFTAELADGNQVLVFLDDTTIDLPKEGVVTLPIGRYMRMGEGRFLNVLREKSGLPEADSYIDMAGKWREGEEAEKVENMRFLIGIVLFVGGWILASCFLARFTADKKSA